MFDFPERGGGVVIEVANSGRAFELGFCIKFVPTKK